MQHQYTKCSGMRKSKEALITIAIGSDYLDFYNKFFRESHERFARKTKRKLIVITDYIDGSNYGKQRHPAWQKLLIFQSQETEGFDKLCWIDADIYITSHSADPFLNVNNNSWGAVQNNIYNLEAIAKRGADLYSFCPDTNKPEYILNTGFFIVNRKNHAQLLESVYSSYDEQPCYENGPLSYHLLNSPPGVELDKSFNLLLPYYFTVHETNDDTIIDLVKKNNFIHFCGGINKDILDKVIFFDKNKFQAFMKKVTLSLPTKSHVLAKFNSIIPIKPIMKPFIMLMMKLIGKQKSLNLVQYLIDQTGYINNATKQSIAIRASEHDKLI